MIEKNIPTKPTTAKVSKTASKAADKIILPAKSAKEPVKKVVAKKKTSTTKIKIIRDNFSMPQDDYLRIAAIKKTSADAGIIAKKNELLRAGLLLLEKLSAAELKKVLARVQGGK